MGMDVVDRMTRVNVIEKRRWSRLMLSAASAVAVVVVVVAASSNLRATVEVLKNLPSYLPLFHLPPLHHRPPEGFHQWPANWNCA